jgi:hypothetical protein
MILQGMGILAIMSKRLVGKKVCMLVLFINDTYAVLDMIMNKISSIISKVI